MPSAQSKLEKQTSTEVLDPSKQIITLVEKKVRNLEKRKVKLDTYRTESKAGKELNEDQKNAIAKYDNVVELLELVKDLQKQFTSIQQENLRNQKKQARREQLERQQQDLRSLQEIFQLQNLAARFCQEEVRLSFLSGAKGALSLPQEKVDLLWEYAKLVAVGQDSAAEHLYMTVEGRSKEFLGTTYRQLKELLTQVAQCPYFTPEEQPPPEAAATAEVLDPPANPAAADVETSPEITAEEPPQPQQPELPQPVVAEEQHYYSSPVVAQAPLQEVLPVTGNFNFLQESQIDMDPAIVAAHPMVPSPSAMGGFPFHHPPAEAPSATEECPPAKPGEPAAAPTLAPEYDPARPIPTQTYTNQNFALHHHPMIPSSIVPNLLSPLGPAIPVHILPASISTPGTEPQPPTTDTPPQQQQSADTTAPASEEQPPAASKSQEEGGPNNYSQRNGRGTGPMRPMSRGGRGPPNTNGYAKPARGGANPKGGNYQGYYQQQQGYNGREGGYGNNNYKRGGGPSSTAPPRGTSSRGGVAPRGGGNNRNYRQ